MKIVLFRIAFIVCISWMLHAQTPKKQPATPAPDKSASDNRGTLIGNVYKNPALDMTITLTGAWEFLDRETTHAAEGIEEGEPGPRPGCRGPLCGTPEINIGLRTKPSPASTNPAVSTIFLAGFKLAPQYMDREQYPLINFADSILSSGEESDDTVSAHKFTAIKLGGRPAFRMLVGDPEPETTHEVGYVVESNGYILLIVGATSSDEGLPKLQSTIEGLKFTPPAQ